jgi:hypothetical protein
VGGSGTFVVSTTGGTAHGFTNLLTESVNHTHTVSGNTANTGTAGASIDVRQPTLYMKYRISTGGQ